MPLSSSLPLLSSLSASRFCPASLKSDSTTAQIAASAAAAEAEAASQAAASSSVAKSTSSSKQAEEEEPWRVRLSCSIVSDKTVRVRALDEPASYIMVPTQ